MQPESDNLILKGIRIIFHSVSVLILQARHCLSYPWQNLCFGIFIKYDES